MHGLSLVAASGGSSLVVYRLLIAVASHCRAWALGHVLSNCGPWVYLPHGKVESSWSRDQTHVPFTGRRIPNYWTTREIPQLLVLIAYLCECDLLSLMYIYLYWRAFLFVIFLFLVVTLSFLLREVPFMFVYFPFYLLLAVLCLHCCVGFSLVAASGGYSLVVLHGLLIVVASLVGEHGL